MSVGAARAHTALYVVAMIVSVIVMVCSAALVGIRFSTDGDYYFARRTDPAPPVVALVWGFLTFLYFLVYFIVRHINSHNFFACIIMDVVFLSVLSIIGIGVMATMALVAVRGRWVHAVQEGFTGGIPTVGIVTVVLGWVLVGVLLAIIIFEVVYTLRQYGRSANFWQLSFLDLTDDTRPLDGPRVRRARLDLEGDEVLPMRAAGSASGTRAAVPSSGVTPFTLPHPDVSPFTPYKTDALPPYEPPAEGMGAVLAPSASTPSAIVPILDGSPQRPTASPYTPQTSTASPFTPAPDMPDWKRAVLDAPMPDWKRDALAGPIPTPRQ
ncbi:hypothetical protein Q8F55_002774 [Vanrija albida]|uniref:MARVEL domain-containing protein n=1 Tax=Vanrija albida TaxID=181172 RepID=A0ABR3QAX3_9TREE